MPDVRLTSDAKQYEILCNNYVSAEELQSINIRKMHDDDEQILITQTYSLLTVHIFQRA